MKKLIFLLISAGLSGSILMAQSTEDSYIKSLYYEATEDFNMNNYKGALTKIVELEKRLGKTNARLSYLAAKSQYGLSDMTAAQEACKKYFASNPTKDAGYNEITEMSEMISAQMQAEAQRQAEEVAARRAAEAEKAQTIALQKRLAEERRANDAENQKLRDAEESAAFKAAQKTNTQEAYQQFIYRYPSGKFTATAKSEMQKKWTPPMRVLKNNKYGYMKDGKMVIKASYDYASEFSEGLARVSKNGKYGFVNEKGKVVVPIKYVTASNFNYGLAVVKTTDNQTFFIDKTGKPFNENIYQDAKSFSEGVAAVQDQYFNYGFIDTKGELVIPNEYTVVSWFREGIAAVGKSENGKTLFTYIDKDGDKLTEGFEFEEAKDFQNGVGRVRKNGKFGLIDKFGSPITLYEFDYISEFSEDDGLALAKKDGYDIYLDKEGRLFAKVGEKLISINL
ncbi:MAG: WG repeat-containing protein [Prevotellaceae bacterium]|jgi:hypothetical protein|nr:WG repeat-containing protein [Prevotellaceae bacterium]